MPPKLVQTEIALADGRKVCMGVLVKNAPNSRSFKIRLVGGGRAVLTKPKYAPMREALEFLENSRAWLAREYPKVSEGVALADFLRGNPAVYARGRRVGVEFIASRTTPFFVASPGAEKLVLAPTEANFAADTERMFLEYAAAELKNLARAEAERTGIGFSGVSVRDQSSRWASRSSSGAISLNWRIALLKPEHQKYIVCHELAHARFMDHSVSFWIFLNRICPGAKRLDREVEKLAQNIFDIKLSRL